jgi:hypothetical protein
MDVFIHYTSLPEDKTLADVVGELNELLDDHGVVCGGEENRLDLDLDDENINPKYAQLAVKNYLQQTGFAKDTFLEIGGMEIGIYL